MVERINGKTILTTPVSAEDLEGIKIGDIIYLNGSMTTCRDVAPPPGGRGAGTSCGCKKCGDSACGPDHPSAGK